MLNKFIINVLIDTARTLELIADSIYYEATSTIFKISEKVVVVNYESMSVSVEDSKSKELANAQFAGLDNLDEILDLAVYSIRAAV